MRQASGMASFTRAELESFRDAEVPDLLGPDLRLLFVGINPGLWTAATQTHFAHPANRFYPALLRGGVITRAISPSDGMTDADRDHLRSRGIGITNLVRRATARAAELTAEELRAGGAELEALVAREAPRVVAVAGITAYRTAFGHPKAVLGRQPEPLAGSELWVVPNPSGLNAHETVATLAEAYAEVARAAGLEHVPPLGRSGACLGEQRVVMTKLMFALWGDLSGLHSAEVHGRIAAAGGIRLQVNVSDEHVERAMRLSTFEPGIDGFASVWTASPSEGLRCRRRAARRRRPGRGLGGRGAGADRAAGEVGRLAARRAEQHRRTPQTGGAHPGGVAAPLAGRPHPVAIATQATFGYSQNLVVSRLTEETPEVSGIVEELFPMAGMDDMHAFYGSDGDDAELKSRLERLMASVARIGADRDLDLVPTSRYLYALSSAGAPR